MPKMSQQAKTAILVVLPIVRVCVSSLLAKPQSVVAKTAN
jgi:hypothetical protein